MCDSKGSGGVFLSCGCKKRRELLERFNYP
jgi:hypothetical protein